MRIHRYYNNILIDVTTNDHLKNLDEDKAINIITELEKYGTYRQGDVLYSLKPLAADDKNV